MSKSFNLKQFIIIVLITSLWINASEVFRYFVFVMPMMKEFWIGEEVAEMNATIFSIWGIWDTLLSAVLVFIVWLFCERFGNGIRSILTSATLVWLSIFVIFWVAASNMGLSDWGILLVALPLSWIEMVVGAWISSSLYMTEKFAS